MVGLVEYHSSDDESDEGRPSGHDEEPPRTANARAAPETSGGDAAAGTQDAQPRRLSGADEAAGPAPSPQTEQQPGPLPPVMGPVPQSSLPLGPSLPPTEASATGSDGTAEASGAPLSPYSANRALIHHLTPPAVADLEIPPSPPGSPPARASKNFEQFLALKKKGTHFNAKLEQSTSLRNPSVMDKLMDYVELDGLRQYETTLSRDLWDPTAFPEAAFVDRLKKSWQRIAKEREADRASGSRTSVDFVPSTTSGDGAASVPGGLAKGDKSRSRWE